MTGIEVTGRGHKIELKVEDDRIREHILTMGFQLRGELIFFVPAYEEDITINFRNIPLEGEDDELYRILTENGSGYVTSIRQE